MQKIKVMKNGISTQYLLILVFPIGQSSSSSFVKRDNNRNKKLLLPRVNTAECGPYLVTTVSVGREGQLRHQR